MWCVSVVDQSIKPKSGNMHLLFLVCRYKYTLNNPHPTAIESALKKNYSVVEFSVEPVSKISLKNTLKASQTTRLLFIFCRIQSMFDDF